MAYELIRDGECLYVGTKEDCQTMVSILEDYHHWDRGKPCISTNPRLKHGTEQDYIDKVLRDKKFEYGM